MALQLRRGSDAERVAITFAEGELVYTIDTKKLYVGDGSTAGGILVSNEPHTLVGDLTGNVTGNVTGNLTGNIIDSTSIIKDDDFSRLEFVHKSSNDMSNLTAVYGSISFGRNDVNGSTLTGFVVGGSNNLFFGHSSTGSFSQSDYVVLTDKKLGIGTFSPTETLDVIGKIKTSVGVIGSSLYNLVPLSSAPTGNLLIENSIYLADPSQWDPLSKGAAYGNYCVFYDGTIFKSL